MIWENALPEIFQHTSTRIFCLHGQNIPRTSDLRDLKEAIGKNCSSGKGITLDKVILLPSRAEYIRRHKHEGLFFQQRYQSSYNDQGETVRQRLEHGKIGISSEDLKELKGWFALEEMWNKPLLQLSSGEWQRFSLCEGLAGNPEILIVPYLLKGLDQYWQYKIFDVLGDKVKYGGMVIFSADVPSNHPGVFNISMEPPSTDQQESTIPSIPPSLIKDYQRYQSGFLSNRSQDVQIQMDGVNIRYGQSQILKDIHWTVRSGEKWNVQGPNGAGKSTLISLVNADNPQGYSQPIKLFGKKYGHFSIWVRKARIAYFGSDFIQYFRSSKSLEDVVHHQLRTPYLDTIQPPERLIDGILNYFDLKQDRTTPYSKLAPDLKRQVLLIVAYLKSSEVLVLDEPYQDFDQQQARRNIHFLESVQNRSPQTVLFVTHRAEHKPGFLSHVLKLSHGSASLS